MTRIRQPPSAFTGEQLRYLRDVAKALNDLPNHSYFTQDSPNGAVQGVAGDRATYIGSTSTLSREWVNANAPGVVSTASWVKVQILG